MTGILSPRLPDAFEATDPVSELVIGAAIEVHRHLGPGLLESAYLVALEHEMLARGIGFASEVAMPIHYKGAALESTLRLDFVVERRLVIELKAVDVVLPVHYAQLLTYLRLGGYRCGLLINFNVAKLVNGVRRFVM